MPLEKNSRTASRPFVTRKSSFFPNDGDAFLWFGPLLLVKLFFFSMAVFEKCFLFMSFS